MQSVIGALRVVLGLNSAAFDRGLNEAQKRLNRFGREMSRLGNQLDQIGKSMTLGITAPIVGLGVVTVKMAADFEAAMGKVSIATQATAAEMAKMEGLARDIGKTTVFSASQSAEAMELLAKTGVSVTDILNGAAKATVDLAAATGAELDPAASAVSDTMNQFGLKAKDLGAIVNQITGAVNESKLDFTDFQQAMAQAGGVASSSGLDFKDFTAALAGTSSMFSSGSDAGTSFKTFLTTMVPKTKAAANAIHDLGLRFFEADGSMRPLREIAQDLQDKLAGLSDEARNDALSKIFGTDAMRTAVGLMKLGAKGIDDITAKIDATDAADQAAKRMGGFNGQLEQLKGSLEELAIAIGQSGILQFATQLVASFAGLIDKLSAASPGLLRVGVVIAGLAAVVGPAVVAFGALASALGALVPMLGVVAGAFAAIGAPVILPIAAAVAGLVGGFLLFRGQIMPVLQDFGKTVEDTLGPKVKPLLDAASEAFKAFAEAVGPLFQPNGQFGQAMALFLNITTRTFNAVVAIVGVAIDLLTASLKIVTALLKGDWGAAFKGALSMVNIWQTGIIKVFTAMAPEVTAWVKKTYEAVKLWLVDKFGDVVKWVDEKVKAVTGFFKAMWDAVVGHSYVPDMVEGIAFWFQKLDAGMVQPAKTATDAVKKNFERLRDDIARIWEGLLTDSERSAREFAAEARTMNEALEKGPGVAGGVSPQQYAEWLRRRDEKDYRDRFERTVQRNEDPGDIKSGVPTPNLMTEDERTQLQGQIYDAWRGALDALQQGGFKGLLQYAGNAFGATLMDRAAEALTDLAMQFTQMMAQANASSGNGGGGWGQVISGLISWFSGTPAFATGGSFKVGGNGGTDSSLVAFRATPGEMVDVRHGNDNKADGGALSIHVTPSPLFNVQVTRASTAAAAASGQMAYSKATRDVPARMQDRNRMRLA